MSEVWDSFMPGNSPNNAASASTDTQQLASPNSEPQVSQPDGGTGMGGSASSGGDVTMATTQTKKEEE